MFMLFSRFIHQKGRSVVVILFINDVGLFELLSQVLPALDIEIILGK
jgi:hypothetical protein